MMRHLRHEAFPPGYRLPAHGSWREVTGKLGRGACSVALAAGLCWPVGLALAAEDGATAAPGAAAPAAADGGSAASAPSTPPAATNEPGASDPSGTDAQGPSSADAESSSSGSSADAESLSDSSASAASEDADKSSESEKDDKKKDADRKAQKAIKDARKHLSEGQAAASKLSGLAGSLDSARAPFDKAAPALSDDIAKWRAMQDRLDAGAKDADRLEGEMAKLRVDSALSASDGMRPGVQTRTAPSTAGRRDATGLHAEQAVDAHLRAQDAEVAYATARASLQRDGLSAGMTMWKAYAARGQLAKLAEPGNKAAIDVEVACGEAHKGYYEAEEIMKDIDKDAEGVREFLKELESAKAGIDHACSAAQDKVASWYEAQDAAVGAKDVLTFGTGLDFMLPEDAFVAKWGKAVDEFYERKGAPMAGYGEVIAREAYKYHIDPRLCAAVSITESGGGAACIRPHNAWGWGAADTDPYNLAKEWPSWEAAIEGWHKGMATNSILGVARTISGLGRSYASSPQWAGNTLRSLSEIG